MRKILLILIVFIALCVNNITPRFIKPYSQNRNQLTEDDDKTSSESTVADFDFDERTDDEDDYSDDDDNDDDSDYTDSDGADDDESTTTEITNDVTSSHNNYNNKRNYGELTDKIRFTKSSSNKVYFGPPNLNIIKDDAKFDEDENVNAANPSIVKLL